MTKMYIAFLAGLALGWLIRPFRKAYKAQRALGVEVKPALKRAALVALHLADD